MARFYRNLDPSDIRLTPFRAYKRYLGVNSYVTYSAQLSTTPIDVGNNALISSSNPGFTSNSKLQNSVWHSIWAHYYRYYYENTKASFGSYDLIRQPRFLSEKALAISIPQSYFGEEIEPSSFAFTVNGTSYVDDYYGNIIKQTNRWVVGGEISASNIVFTTKPTEHVDRYEQYATPSKNYFADQYPAVLKFANTYITSSTYEMRYVLDNSTYATSSITIYPEGDSLNKRFNFQGTDFSITMTYVSSSTNSPTCVLLQKKASTELTGFDENGLPTYISLYRFPYKLAHNAATNKIVFEKSDGFTTLQHVSAFDYNQQYPLALTRSGSTYTLLNGANTSSFADTLNSDGCGSNVTNTAPILIGVDEFNQSGSVGEFGNISFYKTALSKTQYNHLTQSIGFNNPYQTVGITSTKEGMAIITDRQLLTNIETSGISALQYRGTTTIYENEVTCTVSPGQFNFTNNPTARRFDAATNQCILSGFASASDFRPYITRIGLYNDYNELLLIGTLNQPVQLPQNVDTTFILRYDL